LPVTGSLRIAMPFERKMNSVKHSLPLQSGVCTTISKYLFGTGRGARSSGNTKAQQSISAMTGRKNIRAARNS